MFDKREHEKPDVQVAAVDARNVDIAGYVDRVGERLGAVNRSRIVDRNGLGDDDPQIGAVDSAGDVGAARGEQPLEADADAIVENQRPTDVLTSVLKTVPALVTVHSETRRKIAFHRDRVDRKTT